MDHTGPGGRPVSAARTVAALTPYTCVTIDYDTGAVELRPASADTEALAATAVRLDAAAPSWGTVEVPAVLPARAPVPLRWRLAAAPAVLATAAVMVCGRRRRRFRRLVRLACLGRALTPATDRQAGYAVRAVRRAARTVPARWACLEESAAAALLLAAAGQRAEWRHGVATDPVRLHAWIADRRGVPVEELPDTALLGA